MHRTIPNSGLIDRDEIEDSFQLPRVLAYRFGLRTQRAVVQIGSYLDYKLGTRCGKDYADLASRCLR